MANKFLTKTLAVLMGATMLFGSANAETFMSNSADGMPPRLNEDTTLSDIYQAVEFAPVTGSEWSYNYGKYNDMFEWNGYLFGMATLGETNTGDYDFAKAHIDVWDITAGGTGNLYTSWTTEQLGMTNTPVEETRPNKLTGIYVDDNCIYVSAYFGEGNRGMVFIYENNIGQEGGEAVPTRLGSEDVLNDNTKVQSFVVSMYAHKDDKNWLKKGAIGKINNYLIGFKQTGRNLDANTRFAVLDVSDPSNIGEWSAKDRYETDVFTFKTLSGEDRISGSIQDIEFKDKYVYAVGYDSASDNKAEWMNIIDFSVPEEPVVVGRLAFASELYDGTNQNDYRYLTVSGDYAYITTSDDVTGRMQYLYVIDISDKTNPRLISKSTASKEAGGSALGGIKVSWNKDGTEYNESNLTGMSHVSVLGDTLIGLAGKNRMREVYMIRLNSDKTDIEQIAVRRSNAYEGFNQWESGITGEIRNTIVYGNKIYYNIKAELRQYRIGYIELNPELTYGIEMQSLPTDVSSDDGYVVKGEFYDGSAGVNADAVKVSLISASGEAVAEEYIYPDFGDFGNAYIGKWEYELPADVPSGKYTLRAEAACSWGETIDLSGAFDESEFNYTTSMAAPEFTVEASFTENAGTVTANITAENADEAFVPVMALYSSTGKLESVDVGNATQTTETLSVSGYASGMTVKVIYVSTLSAVAPVYPAAVYPAQ